MMLLQTVSLYLSVCWCHMPCVSALEFIAFESVILDVLCPYILKIISFMLGKDSKLNCKLTL